MLRSLLLLVFIASLSACGGPKVGPMEDCSMQCEVHGDCTPRDGACIATKPSHCKESRVCAQNGRCTLRDKEHDCVVGSKADCKQSEECTERGLCSFQKGRCVEVFEDKTGL